jgi:Arc/MetJ-type ribon-helix-helix transcriptional regulator
MWRLINPSLKRKGTQIMAVKKTSATAPLTFDIGVKLLDKIETLQKRSGASSKSEIIRFALAEFDFSSVQIEPKSSKQISVRLSSKAKNELIRSSKKLKVSVGELLRLSVEALPKKIAAGSLAPAIPAKAAPKKAAAKKAAPAKAAPKKAAKKAKKK